MAKHTKVLLDLAETHSQIGDIDKAAEIAMKAEHVLDEDLKIENIDTIEGYKLKNRVRSIYKESEGDQLEPVVTSSTWKRPLVDWQENYERLCNDENEAMNYTAPSAFCHIRNAGNYYSWAKEEVFITDPFVAIIHDVISDKELQIFKNLGRFFF